MTQRSASGKSFGWNAAAVLVAQVSAPVLNAALIIVLARWMGPAPLGSYALLVTAFLVLDQVRLLGMQRFVTREIAVHGDGALHAYRGFRVLVDAGTAVAMGLLVLYAVQIGIGPVAALAFAVGFIPSAAAWANDALFLAFGRADYTARVVLLESTFRMVGSLVVLWVRGPDLVALGAVYSGGRLLAAVVGAGYRRRLTGNTDATHDWAAARSLVRHIPAFFAVTALPLVLLRADLLVVGWIASPADVGLYTAAARLVTIMLLVPDSLMVANFVRIARTASETIPSRLRREVALVLVFCGAVLVPLAAAGALWGDHLVRLVYGERFAGAAGYLAWLIWSVPLFVASRTIGDALIARGHQGRMALVIVASTVVTLPLYAVLTTRFGATGAAAAYVGSIFVLLVLSALAAGQLARRYTPSEAWGHPAERMKVGLEAK